jgi:hypothetical protein
MRTDADMGAPKAPDTPKRRTYGCGVRFERLSVMAPCSFMLALTCGACGALCPACEGESRRG